MNLDRCLKCTQLEANQQNASTVCFVNTWLCIKGQETLVDQPAKVKLHGGPGLF